MNYRAIRRNYYGNGDPAPPNYLLYGGIGVGVLAVIGVIWFAVKKKG